MPQIYFFLLQNVDMKHDTYIFNEVHSTITQNKESGALNVIDACKKTDIYFKFKGEKE